MKYIKTKKGNYLVQDEVGNQVGYFNHNKFFERSSTFREFNWLSSKEKVKEAGKEEFEFPKSKDKNVSIILNDVEIGKNELKEQFDMLNEFAIKHWDLLLAGAIRTGIMVYSKRSKKNYITIRYFNREYRGMNGDIYGLTKIIKDKGVVYAMDEKIKETEKISKDAIMGLASDIQYLLEAGVNEVESDYIIRIEKKK